MIFFINSYAFLVVVQKNKKKTFKGNVVTKKSINQTFNVNILEYNFEEKNRNFKLISKFTDILH